MPPHSPPTKAWVDRIRRQNLEIRRGGGGGGGGSSRPFDNGGGDLQKRFFGSWSSIWSKNKGGARPPGSPGSSPGSATGISGTKILDKKKEKTPLLASLALVKPYP